MKKILFLFYLSISSYCFSQNFNDSIITTFYNQTIDNFFKLNNYHKNTKTILIKTSFYNNNLIKKSNDLDIIYFNNDSYRAKKYKNRYIYFINHNVYVSDSIDINITSGFITLEKRKIFIGIECGGTMGYIPTARYIYDNNLNKWIYISTYNIMEQKVKEEEDLLNSYKKLNNN